MSDCLLILAGGAAPSVFDYFWQSNFAGQVIVVFLVFQSLLAWTVMLGKYFDLTRLRDYNHVFERKIAGVEALLDLEIAPLRKDRSPYALLMHHALDSYRNAMEKGASPQIRAGLVDNSLQRAIAEVVGHYESRMIMLASIVSGAPFLGLLGTVWGVMDAFGAVALQANATIQTLAPGVSGALLTTVAGLLVAIPSVFGYNYLLTRTKSMVSELENFATILSGRIELEDRAKTPS